MSNDSTLEMPTAKYRDLTGQQFGMLKVIRLLGRRPVGRQHALWWECLCECGELFEARGSHLTRGATTNCGCNHGRPGISRALDDLTGRRFERLTALELVGTRDGKGQTPTYWLCECDCGKRKEISRSALIDGTTISCGCYRSERIKAFHAKRKEENSQNPQWYIARDAYQNARGGAKSRGLLFELLVEDVYEIGCSPCFYCGQFDSRNINGVVADFNGIDRLENNVGYIRENVVASCWQCNRAKGTLSKAEFLEWLRKICSHLNLAPVYVRE